MTTFEDHPSSSAIAQQLEEGFAPAWRPEPGDKLIGTVTRLSTAQSDYGPYPVLTIRQDDGENLSVHAFHTALRNQLVRQRPDLGQPIGILYAGLNPGKPGGRAYEDYRVTGVEPTADDFWGPKASASADSSARKTAFDDDDDDPQF